MKTLFIFFVCVWMFGLGALSPVRGISLYIEVEPISDSSAWVSLDDEIKLFTASGGDTLPSELTRPDSLRLKLGYGLSEMRGEYSTGAPKVVLFRTPRGGSYWFNFKKFESESKRGSWYRAVLLDEVGAPTVGRPVFIDLKNTKTGRVIRFHAEGGLSHAQGDLVHLVTEEGKTILFSESGYEVVPFPNGSVRQLKTPTRFVDIEKTGEREAVIRICRADQLLPEKKEGLYVLKGEAEVLREIRWKGEVTETGTSLDVSFDNRLERDKAYSWTYNPVTEDYHFRAMYLDPEELYHENHEYKVEKPDGWESFDYDFKRNDNGSSWSTLKRRRYFKPGRNTLTIEYKKERNGTVVEWTRREPYLEPGRRYGEMKNVRYLDGRWEAYAYNEAERKIVEIRPVPVLPEAVEDDPLIAELADAFSGQDIGAEEAESTLPTTYFPEEPPEEVTAEATEGRVTLYDYELLTYAEEDRRKRGEPRTVTTMVNGEFVERNWYVYGVEVGDNLKSYIEESSTDPSAAFGDPENHRTETVVHGKPHPMEGKPQRIQHADGRLEAFYYDIGSWEADVEEFTPRPSGSHVRTEHTTGRLENGGWTPGTVTETSVALRGKKKVLWSQVRRLGADGEWEQIR